jgi:short-subunit dehydrogenase
MRQPEGSALAPGDRVAKIAVDVTRPETISRMVSQVEDRWGGFDLVVNNAGYGEFGVFESITSEEIQRNFDVNVFGVMNVMRLTLPHFRARGKGAFINVSSGGGIIGLPSTSVYLSTKFALEGFTESVWYELDAINVSVKLVEPGGVETPFITKIGKQAGERPVPTDYSQYDARIKKRISQLSWPRSTPGEIAEVIWTAANDGTRQLRYFHGPGIQHLVEARRTAGEASYQELIRAEFKT